VGSGHLAIMTSTSELRRPPPCSIRDVYVRQKSNKKASSVFFVLYGICQSDSQGTFTFEKITVVDTYFFRYGRWSSLVAVHAVLMSLLA